MVKENLAYVEEQIQKACDKVGRKREEVTLIAVSKTKPVALIDEAIDYGIQEFGENKVQEIMDKFDTVKAPVHWHMIGHLQRNKVKYIVDKVCLIHSVDSYRLAEMIDQEAEKKGVISNILLEVNIAKEDTKFGAMEEDVPGLVEQIAKLPHVRIKGLMTIAPFVENSEKNRVHFRNLRNLYVDIKNKNIDNVDMKILSMGMTNDYEIAIEEGATMIRVGTGIFGERNYTI
ncbi:YggS family pyridoxal phosphate-dependent enzyme [Anaerosporobacter faecicola]|uniref:YggS family pyridoxal phosphate-dependent enzyme n=1 Tax=Anaerosporobacter faecicola TaxID=2718714 RepID=UPI00143A9E8F|nr:YggS family pyridoxal phosphate-dependent enzyme [Anaerosporobacter faecicola]